VFRFADLYPVSQTGVVVNTISPGLVHTGLTRHVEQGVRDYIETLRTAYARTAEMGSRTIMHAMVAGKDSHGGYLHDCKVAK
jgi:NAD(P)-dependent dehydrogenase (short-subunit alcohol dehydrogenase family)